MAQVTSGTVKSNTLWYSTFYVKWTRTSYSVENNTSTINWEAGLITSNGVYWLSNAVKINSIYIDGSVVLSAKTYSNISGNGTHKLASGTKTINHNNDGTKSFDISINGWLYDTGSPTGSSTFELPTIPRASTITVTDANIGSAISIIISKKESSHVHTLTYSFGSLTGTIATKTSDSTIGFTLPTGFYSQIPNAKSGTGTIYCTTYTASGTQVGSTQSSTFTATTNENLCKPAISLTAVDNNATTKALTGDSNKFIKYFSNANVILTATAKNNATISSRKITVGDGKTSTSANATFNNVESASFTGSTTDSRGYSASTTLNKTLINYIKLTCNVEIYRPEPTTGEVYLRVNGNYFNNTFGTVENTITLQYRYKESTSNTWGSWKTITATKSGNTYSYKGSLGTTFDYTKSYNFQINTYDKLMNLTESKTVSQGIPVFDWGENDFNFNVPAIGPNVSHNVSYNELSSFEDVGVGKQLNKSGLYGGNYEKSWYHLINVRHRNGAGDGVSYGLQIRTPYSAGNKLQYRKQASGNWYVWRTLAEQPVTLFENAGGTTSNITLSESAGNFEFMEIFYVDNNGRSNKSVRVHSPQQKNIELSCIEPAPDNSPARTYIRSSLWIINGTSITHDKSTFTTLSSAGVTVDNNQYIKIYRVIGYR